MLLEIVSWLSREQVAVETLARRPGFLDRPPPSRRHPVIQLIWEGVTPEDLEPPVVALTYGGQVYAITDPTGRPWQLINVR